MWQALAPLGGDNKNKEKKNLPRTKMSKVKWISWAGVAIGAISGASVQASSLQGAQSEVIRAI